MFTSDIALSCPYASASAPPISNYSSESDDAELKLPLISRSEPAPIVRWRRFVNKAVVEKSRPARIAKSPLLIASESIAANEDAGPDRTTEAAFVEMDFPTRMIGES